MGQLDLIGGGHDHHARQTGEICDIERAGMGRAVGADQPGAVDGESDRQTLHRHVVHHLIVGALEEGRVDGGERLVAFGGKPRGEGHGMLLGDADIEAALGENLGEAVEPGARRHGRGDGDDLVVGARLLDQGIGKHLGVARRRAGGGGFLRPGDDVELADAVEFVGGDLGGAVALALLGDDVDQDRPVLHGAHIAQHGQQVIEIMPVDRADIIEAELLEQGAAGPEAAGELLGAGRAQLPALGQELAGKLLEKAAEAPIGAAGDQLGEIGAHGPGRRRDRHVVVVEDHDQAGVHGAGIVHRLVGHARAHGAVADHGDDVMLAAGEVARHGHAEPGGDRGRGMAGAEGVVFALGALAEARQTIGLPQRADAAPPAGQDLVRIGLMADIPDQPVVRRVEDMMQSNGELDHAKPSAEMAAGDRDRVDQLLPELARQLLQLAVLKRAQIRRSIDAVKQGRGLFGAHFTLAAL